MANTHDDELVHGDCPPMTMTDYDALIADQKEQGVDYDDYLDGLTDEELEDLLTELQERMRHA